MTNDNISNLLTVLRNAYVRSMPEVEVGYSNVVVGILDVLKARGWISEYKTFKQDGKKYKMVNISLKYDEGVPALNHISRISKPSLRVYVKSKDINRVLGGIGTYIISTPRGVLDGEESKKRKLGGEILCKVY